MTTSLLGASHASVSLKKTLLEIGGVVGVGLGLHAVYEKIKGANMEMMGLQKRVTGTHFAFTQWGKDVSTTDRMKESMAVAAEMGGKLETVARHLHLELDPVATIYNSMAASAGKLGMSQEDTLKLVEQLAAATRVYGSDAQTVAMTVSRALETGGIRGVDNFAKMLRQKLNLKEEGKGLAPAEMLRRLSGGLGGTVEAAQMMGGGLEGTMADMHRESDALVRLLTGPAFKSVATMMHQWVEYSAKNREHVEAVAKSVAGGLVTGLTVVKDITVTIAEHWKSIAALWVANKGFGMIAAGGGIGGAAGAAGIGSRASLGALSITAAAVYIGATELTEWIGRKQDEGINAEASIGQGSLWLAQRAAGGDPDKARAFRQLMIANGLATAEGGLNQNKFTSALESSNLHQRAEWGKVAGVTDIWSNTDSEKIGAAMGRYFTKEFFAQSPALYNMMDDVSKFRMMGVMDPTGTGKKADVKVTINRIEVVSDDPDRFAFGLDELVQTAASRRGITPGYLPPAWQKG